MRFFQNILIEFNTITNILIIRRKNLLYSNSHKKRGGSPSISLLSCILMSYLKYFLSNFHVKYSLGMTVLLISVHELAYHHVKGGKKRRKIKREDDLSTTKQGSCRLWSNLDDVCHTTNIAYGVASCAE